MKTKWDLLQQETRTHIQQETRTNVLNNIDNQQEMILSQRKYTNNQKEAKIKKREKKETQQHQKKYHSLCPWNTATVEIFKICELLQQHVAAIGKVQEVLPRTKISSFRWI